MVQKAARIPNADSFRQSVWWVGILFLLLCLIPIYVFEIDKTDAIENHKKQLSEMSDQKSHLFDSWLSQRYGDAELLRSNPIFLALFQAPENETEQYHFGVSSLFTKLERNMGYEALTAVNRKGEMLFSLGKPKFSPNLLNSLSRHFDTHLTWNIDQQNDLYLNVVIPIRDPNSYFIDGYVILDQSVKNELLPAIQSWPNHATPTGYTMLLHTDEDNLATVKIPPNNAWGAEIKVQPYPEDQEDLLRIALSQTKETELVTLNGKNIVASFQPIGFTDWYILVQQSEDDIVTPLYRNLYTLLGILIGLSLFVLFFLYQHARQSQYRFELQLERQTAEKDRLLRHFFDLPFFGMAITHAKNGHWIRINDYFCQLLGYSWDEMQKLGYRELLPKKQAEQEASLMKDMESGDIDGFQRESQFIHKDGHLIDVNLDTRCVRNDKNISFFINVIEDITLRKKSEQALNKKNKLYNMLSHTNQAIVHSKTQEVLFRHICRTIVEDGGFTIAFLAECIHDNQDINILEIYGDDKNFVSSITKQKRTNPSLIPHTGIMQSITQQRSIVINNYQKTTITMPFHYLAKEANINASGYFPIYHDDKMYGVLAVYSEEVEFFDESTLDTLYEMAGDISFSLDNMKRDNQLIKSERLFHNLTSFVKVGIFRLTPTGELHYINEFGQQLLNLRLPQQSDIWLKMFNCDARSRQAWLFELMENGESKMECQLARDTQSRTVILHAIAETENDQIIGYIGTISDITNIKESEQRLKYLAHFDSLTGLPNRTSLTLALENHIQQQPNHAMALLLVDLDRFKDVNDSFGHPIGNALLKDVTGRLTQHMLESDQVCRIGGDEFTILLKSAPSLPFINAVAYDIIQLLRRPFHLPNGQDVILGASIGISRYPDDGKTSSELLQKADTAMYHAKQKGRNCYQYFTGGLSQIAQQRLEMEIRLKQAIEQHHLRAFFQPQVNMLTGEITGAEALIRWQDPEEGLIPPFRFIPLAEETGLIKSIGEWILKETCRQGKAWLDQGLPPITLAVNISPVQFRYNDLLASIELTLKETQFPAHLLEVEITESVLMSHEEKTIEILNKIRDIGVRIAIDDFGTGYSSLSYLKKMPLDVLKIDKSFVDDIPHKKDDMEIATAIVGMAHTLRLKVLAEGVETPEQLNFLREQGCDFYQGYLMSKPIPADEFEQLWQQTLQTAV